MRPRHVDSRVTEPDEAATRRHPEWETDAVGDQAPIPIESRLAKESESGGPDGGTRGTAASSGRVVHEPGGWPRLATVVAVVGLVLGGLAWALLDDDPLPAGDEEEPAEPPARPDPQAETRREFAEAMLQFGQVRSFSYRGSVHAEGGRPFGVGPSAVGDLTVTGAVQLDVALSREVTADARGRAAETLTSGTTVWTRSAASAGRLDAAPWAAHPGATEAVGTLDMQVLARLLATAGGPRGEAPDAAGRRVIRATLPTRDDGAGHLLPLGGADVLLSLDNAGNVAHVVVTWPPHEAQLVLDVEISGHNQTQDIAPPDRGPAALRRTVPIQALVAEGVPPRELGRVPRGWRLTGAWVRRNVTPRADCQALTLAYRDPAAASGNYLFLQQAPQACGVMTDATGEPQRLVVGSFEGSFVESPTETAGALFDGTTAIMFETDLPADDVASLLASLRPFDPEADPAG
ncbi:MAG TPA: hypothetical protein VKD21_00410 [Acidimicrobiales bacterium]|nr:hypothetical protein [Acidimicrobiales bacterium]